MTYHVISTRQLLVAVVWQAALVAALLAGLATWYEYHQLPEVQYQDGKCVKVINYRNGDAYSCADLGVALRRFNVLDAK